MPIRLLIALVCVTFLAIADDQQPAPAPTVHVTTDRPWYQPGEIIRWRALVFDAVTRAPTASGSVVRVAFSDDRGRSCADMKAIVADGVAQ